MKQLNEESPSIRPEVNDETKKNASASLFPQKTFQMRSSILTELLEIPHIRSIRQIFISILVLLVLQVIVTDLFETGTSVISSPPSISPFISFFSSFRIHFRFDVIRWNFSNLSSCFTLWLCLFLCTCTVVYSSFHYWAYKRLDFIPPGKGSSTSLCKRILTISFCFTRFIDHSVLFDWFSLIGYCAYIALFLYYPVHRILQENYPIATRIIILSEQVKLNETENRRIDRLNFV